MSTPIDFLPSLMLAIVLVGWYMYYNDDDDEGDPA